MDGFVKTIFPSFLDALPREEWSVQLYNGLSHPGRQPGRYEFDPGDVGPPRTDLRRYPLKVALDGGFASKDNLKLAKGRKIKDVCFAKRRGLEIEDMCRSTYVYRRLSNFRAGIESGMSWLKRCFGFARCTWKTLDSFKSYVWASIVSANLLTLVRNPKTAT